MGVASMVVVLIITVYVTRSRFIDFDCDETVINTFYSPATNYVALLYERDCGATTPITTILNIQPYTKEINLRKGAEILVVRGRTSVLVKWLDENHVELKYQSDDVFKSEAFYKGIHVQHL